MVDVVVVVVGVVCDSIVYGYCLGELWRWRIHCRLISLAGLPVTLARDIARAATCSFFRDPSEGAAHAPAHFALFFLCWFGPFTHLVNTHALTRRLLETSFCENLCPERFKVNVG